MRLISILTALLLSFIQISVFAQAQLLKTRSFSIYSDKVIQDNFQAQAKSSTEITSDYKSSFKKNTSRNLVLKFSINGSDNERKPGQDHHFTLSSDKLTDTAYFKFAQSDPAEYYQPQQRAFLEHDEDLLIRLDMRDVISDLKSKGYYEAADGSKIRSDQFEGVYVAGGTLPLDWNFPQLKERKQFQLQDPDGDGIYEVKIHFEKVFTPAGQTESRRLWKLTKDISAYPQYKSPNILIDALYNMALEEMIMDIRPDGAFMAGAQWEGVWTRDISYSILLSLAIVNPDASKTSLMAKVKNGRIIQDTGTGGAWPVSSDRMVWALAAWEIYKVTGDKQWLKQVYSIIKKSYQSDILTIYDKKTGLMNGESSFLDWREQSYPAWMDPKDIYLSKNLGTNAVHFQAYNILAQMARVLGEPSDEYLRIAERIKKAMNKYLWIDDKGYYGQYLYGREYFSLSPKSEALGEALTVLFDIAESHKQNQIVERTPVMDFGIPTIYPQIPNIPPYHNNSVWPFVESFWALASAKVNNVNSVKLAMASIYRAAALFLTNKENIVVSTGDHMGTEINSDRQLWSLAGNLALTYRLIYGMNFEDNRLILKPFIPEEFNGERALTNFKYRNSILDITLEGYGNRIKSVTIDGKTVKDAVIPGNMKGKHNIVIRMANNTFENSSVNLVNDLIAPETPQLKFSDSLLRWDKTEGADRFALYRNGTKLFETKELSIKPNTSELFSQYQVLALSGNLTESFLSAPVNLYKRSNKEVIEAETINRYKANQYSGFTGDGYIKLSKDENKTINFTVTVPNSGGYSIDFRYSNGNGPINTDNKCAIRNLKIDGNFAGAVILPQRGDGSWTDWGYSNPVSATLTAGSHNLELYFDEINDNMNGTENSALLDHIRITEVRNNGK